MTGNPVDGSRELVRKDPKTRGPVLFQKNCATCHTYTPTDPKDEVNFVTNAETAKAGDLAGYGTEKWIRGLLEKPSDPKYFGRTKLTGMTKWRTKVDKERKPLEKTFKALDKISDATVEVWSGKLNPAMRAELPREIDHLLNIAVNGRDEEQRDQLVAYVRTLDKSRHVAGGLAQSPFTALAHLHLLRTREAAEKRLAELKARDPQIATTMVLKTADKARETRIHVGDFAASSSWSPACRRGSRPRPPGKSRLDLAKWIVDPKNP